MTSERQEIAAKVRALLAKTVDKGCTEQEAVAAASKAKELMDRYQVDLSEAELEEDGFAKGTARIARAAQVQRAELDRRGHCGLLRSEVLEDIMSAIVKNGVTSSLASVPMSSSPIGCSRALRLSSGRRLTSTAVPTSRSATSPWAALSVLLNVSAPRSRPASRSP